MSITRKLSISIFLIFLTSTALSASVELDEGWNTFSVDSTVDKSALVSTDQCDFRPVQDTENYFYSQNGQGDYSEVSTLYPWNAYYGWVSEGCTLQTESSEWSNTVELDSGEWNLIRSPGDISSFESSCSISQGSLDFMYYTESGGEITGIGLDDALFSENRGIFAYPTESCSVTYSSNNEDNSNNDDQTDVENPDFEQYLQFDEVNLEQDTISEDSGSLDILFSFKRESVESHQVDADVGLVVDGQRLKTESFSDSEDEKQITASWDEIWSGEDETVELGLVLESRKDGNYHWDIDEEDLGSVEVDRCSESHAYSEYNDECVEKNMDLDVDDIEHTTVWDVETEQNTVHKMESIEASSENNAHELSLNTWRDNDNNDGGYCGRVYFETSSLDAGDTVFEVTQNRLDDGNQYTSQMPQDPFIEVNGEKVSEDELDDIPIGETRTIELTLSSDDNVRIGIEDTSLGCNGYARRTGLSFSVIESSRESCTELGYSSCQERDDCRYSNDFNTCLSN